MSRCPYCDRELTGFQTLCDDCYEKRRVEIAKPRSFVEILRQLLENPLNITDQDVAETMPISLMLFFWCFGLILCWFGGWAKARYQYSILSDVVLHGTLLCVGLALALTLAIARRGLRVDWDAASEMFLLNSIGVSGYFFIGSNAIESLTKTIKW